MVRSIFKYLKKRDQKHQKNLGPFNSKLLNDDENVDNEKTEQDLGCHPCNKPCVYCQLLSKTEADHFKSVQTG